MASLLLRGNGEEGPAIVASSPVAPYAGAVPLEPALIGVMPDLTSPDAVWSPDGEALAVEKESGLFIAWAPEFPLELLLAEGTVSRRRGSYRPMAWSPDGTSLTFAGVRTDKIETIYVVDVDDPCCNARDVLPADIAVTGEGVSGKRPNVWLDNETLAFDAKQDTGLRVPMVVNIETGDVREVTSFRGARVTWSPDRQWIALQSAQPAQRSGTLGVLQVATGEAWDLPLELGTGFYDLFQAWLADSSGLLYVPSGEEGVLKLAYVDEQRIVTLVEGETPLFYPDGKSLISPDGRFATVQGISLGDCPSRADRSSFGQCLGFLDVESGEAVSSVFFPAGSSFIVDGSYGLVEWVGNDAVAFVGLRDDPGRAPWLIQNPAQPQRIVWQEETPLYGFMGIDPSPDGQYAVITNPTSYGPNVWEARIFRMP